MVDLEGLKSIHKHECEATRLVADPNIEAAAKARYEIERDHVSDDWPSWTDLGDFGRRTQVEFIKPSVAAALTTPPPEDTE